MRDRLRSQGRGLRKLPRELGLRKLLGLNLDVSTDEVLSAETAFTYADSYAMLANENAVVWLTPHLDGGDDTGRVHEARSLGPPASCNEFKFEVAPRWQESYVNQGW
jgi:hypothetical protein